MEIDDYKEIKSYSDFLRLKDRKFVLWRLLRTQELSDFWRRFMAEHPELEEEFERAIAVCDSVRINERCYPDTDALYRRIEETILRQKRQRAKVVRMRRLMAAAAIALLLLIPATYLGYVKFMTVGEHQDELVGQILQSENVELLLGNRKIVLQDSADVRVKDGCIIYGAAGTKINLRCGLQTGGAFGQAFFPYIGRFVQGVDQFRHRGGVSRHVRQPFYTGHPR